MVFLGVAPGGERVQLLGERDVALVRGHLEAGVGELVQLLRDGGLHLRVHVPGVEHRDAAGEVDVAAPLDVPDLRVAGALGVHRERVGYAARYGQLATGVQFGIGRQGSSFGSGFSDRWQLLGDRAPRAPGGTRQWRRCVLYDPPPRAAHLPRTPMRRPGGPSTMACAGRGRPPPIKEHHLDPVCQRRRSAPRYCRSRDHWRRPLRAFPGLRARPPRHQRPHPRLPRAPRRAVRRALPGQADL